MPVVAPPVEGAGLRVGVLPQPLQLLLLRSLRPIVPPRLLGLRGPVRLLPCSTHQGWGQGEEGHLLLVRLGLPSY